jgi:glycosyltransferase involved in cell wall biosynthesis
MRIVHLVSSLQVGGMEQFVLRLADEQCRLGHEAGVLALSGGPLLDQAQRGTAAVRVLARSGVIGRVCETAAFLRRLRPEVLHPHNPSSLHYAVLGRAVSRAKVVLTYHGRGVKDSRAPRVSEWRRVDTVVSVSTGALTQLPEGVERDRLRVIRNGVAAGVPARSRREVREELGLGDRPTGILVARVDGLKGHETVVRALARLHECPELAILIAGDGAERSRIEALARELGIGEDRLRFLGFRSDVVDLLGAADFFLLPSVTEGLPLSLLEAMSMGLPAIVTPVGGMPEVISDGREGVFVPVDDDAALAAAMLRLARDPALRSTLGEAARKRAQHELSFERMTREYLQLYQELLERGGRSIRPLEPYPATAQRVK